MEMPGRVHPSGGTSKHKAFAAKWSLARSRMNRGTSIPWPSEQRRGVAGGAAGPGTGTDPAVSCRPVPGAWGVIPNTRDKAAKQHDVISVALLNMHKWLS